MTRPSVETYGLAVCFTALLCFVIALGVGLYDLLQIASPEFTLNAYEHERHQSNDSFRTAFPMLIGPSMHVGSSMTGAVPPPIPPSIRAGLPSIPESSEDEITRQREERYRSVLRAERRRGGQSLARVGIVMAIDMLVFFPHWILARRVRVSA